MKRFSRDQMPEDEELSKEIERQKRDDTNVQSYEDNQTTDEIEREKEQDNLG